LSVPSARGEETSPFQLTKQQLVSSNKLFFPMAVGFVPTAVSSLRTSVAIDATKDPGVELLATFLPAATVPGGVRRIAATQILTATVAIQFDDVLPIYWLASVLRAGDIAPNQLAQTYSSVSDQFGFHFGDLEIVHQSGAWQLPHYDSTQFSVNVGFGIGQSAVAWGYSVPGGPGQNVQMDVGSYQFVRSNGQDRIGDPVQDNLEAWTMPLGSRYSLIFDQSGNGVLSKLSP
jgi:hypothetical protein